MGNHFDHRPDWNNSGGHQFKTKDVEAIETTGTDSDYVVRLQNGEDHYFRCSCCITFHEREGITYINIL